MRGAEMAEAWDQVPDWEVQPARIASELRALMGALRIPEEVERQGLAFAEHHACEDAEARIAEIEGAPLAGAALDIATLRAVHEGMARAGSPTRTPLRPRPRRTARLARKE